MSPLPPSLLDLLPGAEDPTTERFAQAAEHWLDAKGDEAST